MVQLQLLGGDWQKVGRSRGRYPSSFWEKGFRLVPVLSSRSHAWCRPRHLCPGFCLVPFLSTLSSFVFSLLLLQHSGTILFCSKHCSRCWRNCENRTGMIFMFCGKLAHIRPSLGCPVTCRAELSSVIAGDQCEDNRNVFVEHLQRAGALCVWS